MCGLAGFTGVTDPKVRLALVKALGEGIDDRGGHAIGFTSVHENGVVRYARAIGMWTYARARFLRAAAKAPVCMLHARFATHNNAEDVNCAHPFAIQRNGRTALWGAHNGSSSDAMASAWEHNRTLTVDSKEVLELLADGLTEEIRKLEGWGVLTWIRADDRQKIRMSVLTDSGDLYVARTECGAVVYGSTAGIVQKALKAAGMVQVGCFKTNTGTVYYADATGFYIANEPEVRFTEWEYKWDWTSKGKGAYLGASFAKRDRSYLDEEKGYNRVFGASGRLYWDEEKQVYVWDSELDDEDADSAGNDIYREDEWGDVELGERLEDTLEEHEDQEGFRSRLERDTLSQDPKDLDAFEFAKFLQEMKISGI